jgi:hypothetical protein
MAALITLIVVLCGVLAGVAFGWYLRGIKVWCPQCGDALACAACGTRPTWSAPGRAQRLNP